MRVLLQHKGGAVAARAPARRRPRVRDGPVRAHRLPAARHRRRRAAEHAQSTDPFNIDNKSQ